MGDCLDTIYANYAYYDYPTYVHINTLIIMKLMIYVLMCACVCACVCACAC